MNQADFGRLVTALRKEHTDDIRPWSQKRLAEEVNLLYGREILTEDIVSNVERGSRRLDGNNLAALARALQLTSEERKEFFLAASGVENEQIAQQGDSPKDVLDIMITKMKQVYLPAFILDNYCDIVAINTAVMRLLDAQAAGLSMKNQMATRFGFNMLQFVFSDKAEKHYKSLMGVHWEEYAYQSMMYFRSSTLRYRFTPYFQELFRELKKYRSFKRYWRDVYFTEAERNIDNVHIHLNIPDFGKLVFFSTYLQALTTAGHLRMFVYVPRTEHTARVFSEMMTGVNSEIITITSCPACDGG